MRVLLVSDDPRTLSFVRFGSNLLRAELDVVGSLAEAIRALERTRYHAAILDVRWDCGAATLGSWIREYLCRRGILPVLSAESPLSKHLEQALRLPGAVFLRKNFDLLDLQEAIHTEAMVRELVG